MNLFTKVDLSNKITSFDHNILFFHSIAPTVAVQANAFLPTSGRNPCAPGAVQIGCYTGKILKAENGTEFMILIDFEKHTICFLFLTAFISWFTLIYFWLVKAKNIVDKHLFKVRFLKMSEKYGNLRRNKISYCSCLERNCLLILRNIDVPNSKKLICEISTNTTVLLSQLHFGYCFQAFTALLWVISLLQFVRIPLVSRANSMIQKKKGWSFSTPRWDETQCSLLQL